MKIGVIIPCFNEEQYVGKLLESLSKSVYYYKNSAEINVYACDNGSSDKTLEIIYSFSKSFSSLTVLEEKEKGDGLAMLKAAEAAFNLVDWIISIDADCVVPIDYISKWAEAIHKTSFPILTGYFVFPEAFHKDFPNASKLIQQAASFNKLIKEVFGIVNICGANHAIQKEFYYKAGGYSQPFIIENSEKKLIAGNDWDFGTKSRMLNQEIGYVDVFNESSDRRASIDVKSFITGIAYEGVFHSYRDRVIGKDIYEEEMQDILFQNKLRTVKHYALKPTLADNSILDKSKTKGILGEELIVEIKEWITANEIKDIYKDRNGFIYGSLEDFHKAFGLKVYNKINESVEK
jgi:glycosyltransferase involved in cell wall biosynthesis